MRGGSLLVFVLGALLAFVSCIELPQYDNSMVNKQFSFAKPFLRGHGAIQYWSFGGTTVVTDDYIRLTPASPSRAGFIWTISRVNLEDWEVILEFKISGGGRLGADGFAFWYTQEPMKEGPVYGSKDFWTGLMISFDTFDNDGQRNNPAIVAIENDGTKSFSAATDGMDLQLASCQAYFRSTSKNTRARIRYEGSTNRLWVWTDSYFDNNWILCIDGESVVLPPGYYFGLSAATGALFDNHDIYSVTTYSLRQAEPLGQARTGPTLSPASPKPPISVRVAPQQEPEQPVPPQPVPPQQVRGDPSTQQMDPYYSAILDKLNKLKSEGSEQIPQERQDYPPLPQSGETNVENYLQSLLSSSLEAFQRLEQQLLLIVEVQRKLAESSLTEAYMQTELEAVELHFSSINAANTRAVESLTSFVQDLKTSAGRIGEIATAQVSLLNTIRQQTESLARETKLLNDKIGSTAANTLRTIESRTSLGFWVFFVLFQVAIVAALVIWKKLRDDIARKII
ncbi:Protein ERGIC-53 [Pelomyxa schiedti]|nr:Protein ERGIC-53 [Pelomyxa schiedti]